jgi:hypothetical protein
MATTAKSNRTNSRTVVLLRESAKVSSGEIIRRSLDSYESIEARVRKEEEEKVIEAALAIINEALQSANRSLERTCDRLDELHLQLNREKSSESEREPYERRKANSADHREYQAVG